MVINKVDKRVVVDRDLIIYYQIHTEALFKKLRLSSSETELLFALAQGGEVVLKEFCQQVVDMELGYGSVQSVRNALSKLQRHGFVVKRGSPIKKVAMSPALNIQTQGNILLDYKLFCKGEA